MSQVDETLTRKVAELARLELTDEEVRLYTGQIRTTLGYVDQIRQVEVEGIEPLTHPLSLAPRLREDRVEPWPLAADGRPKVLRDAPEVLEDGFKVPPIL